MDVHFDWSGRVCHRYFGHSFSPYLGAPVVGADGPEVECIEAVNMCAWCLVRGQSLLFLGRMLISSI